MPAGSLAASGQSDTEPGRRLDISLSGTWVGTVKLQRYKSGGWVDTGSSWTSNVETMAEAGVINKWRLDFTRTSGTLAWEINGETAL